MNIPKLPSKQVIVGILVCSVVVVFLSAFFHRNDGTYMQSPRAMLSQAAPMMMGNSISYSSDTFEAGPAGFGDTNVFVKTSSGIVPPGRGTAGVTMVVPNEHKEVKEGSLALIVNDLDGSIADIRSIASTAGGFVHSVNMISNQGRRVYGSVSVRVPNDSFDTVMEQIALSGNRVLSTNEHTTDVTLQYVDLEARIRGLKAQEEQYLTLMKRSGEVKDVLAVVNELSRVRTQIEQLEGERNYLGQQIAYATINVDLTEEADPLVARDEWSPRSVVKETVQAVLRHMTALATIVIAMVIWLPVMLVQIGLFLFIIWALWKIAVMIFERITGSKLSNPFQKK